MTRSSHPTVILKWAAHACADEVSEYAHEILTYWDAIAIPREWMLCWEKNAGPPLSLRLSIRERLLANTQSEVHHAQSSEIDSKVILMGHEIVKLLRPALVYSKGFFKLIVMVLL